MDCSVKNLEGIFLEEKIENRLIQEFLAKNLKNGPNEVTYLMLIGQFPEKKGLTTRDAGLTSNLNSQLFSNNTYEHFRKNISAAESLSKYLLKNQDSLRKKGHVMFNILVNLGYNEYDLTC